MSVQPACGKHELSPAGLNGARCQGVYMVSHVAKLWSKLHLWKPDASEFIVGWLKKPIGLTILI